MLLMVLFIVFFLAMFASKSRKLMVRRCWDAPPDQPKVHHWIVQEVPGTKQIILVCKVCGQKPGEQ